MTSEWQPSISWDAPKGLQAGQEGEFQNQSSGDSSMIIFDLIQRYEKYSLLGILFFSGDYVIYLGRTCAMRQGLTRITHSDMFNNVVTQ